jgi:hypothetical protein
MSEWKEDRVIKSSEKEEESFAWDEADVLL